MNRAKDAAREIAELHGSIATPSEGRADNVRSAVQALRRNSNVISPLVAKPLPDLKQLVDRNSDEVLKLLLPVHLTG